MSDTSREALRARINASSKDEVILEEMIRRGFWKPGEKMPTPPEELIKRQGEIRRELESLSADAASYQNSERALKKIQLERMKAARERRKETKLKNAKARYDRAHAWHDVQNTQITHLGENVSAALHGSAAKPERLEALNLPALNDPPALASAMGIQISELRFLAFNRTVSRIDHYSRFTIPKKTGGVREISAPMPRLKRAQYWILHNILMKIPGTAASHGFRPGHSIVTNALPHAGKRVVINIDLKDFFPTISYARVKGLFVSLGYAESVAASLALMCTNAERDKFEIDGRTWLVAREGRRLPQGAPTSPAIANIIASRLDKRMTGAAHKLGFTYTRYADDMTFSGDPSQGTDAVNKMIWQARLIAEAEGFTFNDKKTRVMGSGTRQDVTGLVVNVRPAVSRVERRRFRAWLHAAENAARERAPLPIWTNAKGAPSDPMGFASYLAMVDADRGAPLVRRTKAIVFGHASATGNQAVSGKLPALSRATFRKASAEGVPPRDNWWSPAPRAAPKLEPITIEKPKAAAAAATASSSVPRVPRANESEGARSANASNASRSNSPTTPPAKSSWGLSKPSFIKAVLLSCLALPLLLVPMIGGFVAGMALYLIWSAYLRGRKRS